MKEKVCTHCGRRDFRRLNRHGWLQCVFLTALGLYPWECIYCRFRRFFRDPGKTSRRYRAKSNEMHSLDTPGDGEGEQTA